MKNFWGLVLGLILVGTTFTSCTTLTINIGSPDNGEELTSSPIRIKGSVSDPGATVTVNDIEAEVVNGRFSSDWVQLAGGKNTIRVVATLGERKVSKIITVVYNPVLSVSFSLPRVRAKDELSETPTTVKGRVSDSRARVTVNDREVEVAEDGTFYTLVELVGGNNIFKVVATLGGQKASETKTAFFRPQKPLALEIKSPEDEAEFNIDLLKISGTVSDPDATVMVNGIKAQLADDGSFYAYIELKEGKNPIQAVALRGQERFSETIGVIYSPPPSGTVTDSLSLEIDSPEHGTEHKVNLLKVKGTVSDPEATVVVNGIEAKVAEDGTYYAYIELAEGENDIEAIAMRRLAKSSETIYITFSPALVVYLDMPRPDWSVDYTKVPLTVTGSVSNPDAMVTVNGSEVVVSPDGRFSGQVLLKEGSNAIEAVAALGKKTDTASLVFMSSSKGVFSPVPGRSRFDDARLRHDDYVELKPGEIKSLDVTLETHKDGPGKFSWMVYDAGEYLLPEGLEVSLEPPKFKAYSNTTYHLAIIIKTSPELSPGEYWLRIEHEFENAPRGGMRIRVNVVQ